MLKNYCSEILSLAGLLDKLKENPIPRYDGTNRQSIVTNQNALKRLFDLTQELLIELSMPTSSELCQQAKSTLQLFWITENDEPKDIGTEQISRRMHSLYDCVVAELQTRLFYRVPNDLVEHYNHIPFEKTVVDSFPKAVDDMREAGKCYALGRNTAAAFHLMRVAEHGLNRIKDEFDLPEVKSWGAFLRDLREYAIKDKSREKGIMALHAKIGAIKAAWRDDTMHVVRHYSSQQTNEVLQSVTSLMTEVSTGLP